MVKMFILMITLSIVLFASIGNAAGGKMEAGAREQLAYSLGVRVHIWLPASCNEADKRNYFENKGAG